MKKSDLYREWARVLDMCEGTDVSPGLCWMLNGLGRGQDCIPKFDSDDERYEFAVAILEGKHQISLLSGRHYFSDFHDAQKVANAFDKLLSENTK